MVIELMSYKVQSIGISDIGLVRLNNEDVWAQVPKKKFYVLADGMGGHQAGEVAAREAVSFLCSFVESNKTLNKRSLGIEEARSIIVDAFEAVNAHVFKLGRQDIDLRGMGTTLCCLYFHPKGLIYGNVGDSRIYCLRDKKLTQLSKDHSLLRELIDLGQVSERQSDDFIYKNIITKAIGTEQNPVRPSVDIFDIWDKDLYMMCTDGLSDLVKREEMESIINQSDSIKAASEMLVNSAKNRGGHDNITIVMVKVQGKHETKGLSR